MADVRGSLLYFGLRGGIFESIRKEGDEMTEERKEAERQTGQIIEAIRTGGDERLLQVAALSYAKGIKDGAQIVKLAPPPAPAVA